MLGYAQITRYSRFARIGRKISDHREKTNGDIMAKQVHVI